MKGLSGWRQKVRTGERMEKKMGRKRVDRKTGRKSKKKNRKAARKKKSLEGVLGGKSTEEKGEWRRGEKGL